MPLRSGSLVAAVALVVAAGYGVNGAAATARVGCSKLKQRHLVLISSQTGRVDCSFPDALPVAMVTDGRGGWFIADGPQVFSFDGVQVHGIAHLRPDGSLDRRWRGRVPHLESQGGVGSLVRVGDTLYASSSGWVGSYDVRSGTRRWAIVNRKGGWGVGLAANRSSVFVGGFGNTSFNGVPHPAPVAIAARTGRVLPWRAALPRRFDYEVGPLAVDQGRLFMTAIGRKAGIQETVAVDARTGSLTGWQAPPANVGGPSFAIHGLLFTADQSGALSESTGKPVAAFSHVYGDVYAAAGDTLYLAGDCGHGSSFSKPGHDDIGAINLATGKPTNWAPSGFARHSALGFACFQTMAADANQVLAAVS